MAKNHVSGDQGSGNCISADHFIGNHLSGDRASGNCISGGPPYNKVCIFRMSR